MRRGLVAAAAAMAAVLPASAAGGALPGGTGKIAVTGTVGERQGILTMEPDGSNEQVLTARKTFSLGPHWSPNGRRVVFEFVKASDGRPHRIGIVRADGSGFKLITDGKRYSDLDPTWSPNGKRIAFVRQKVSKKGDFRKSQLWVMKANGRRARQLTTNHKDNQYPTWSRTGGLAWVVSSNHRSWVRRIDQRTGARSTILPKILSQYEFPHWSPDGSSLVYDLFELPEGVQNIYKVTIPGGTPVMLTDYEPPSGGYAPAWSPDGERIAWTEATSDGELHIWTMDADGDNRVQITGGPLWRYTPDWQPLPG